MARIRNPLHLEIIPSPGTNNPDWASMEKKIELVLPFAESIHIDLLDGKFAPNTTSLDPTPFKKYAGKIILEAHFMVENPEQYIEKFAEAGFTRFIGQVEQMKNVEEFIARTQMWGEVGLAVDSTTGVETIEPYLEDLDVVLVMTVKAGWSNQTFLPEMLEKVGRLRQKDPLLAIEVDGGITDATILAAKETGATRFVSTGYMYGTENPAQRYQELLKLIEQR